MATETAGQRLDRKTAERGEARDKQIAADHKAEEAKQAAILKATEAVTRDKDGDPIPIVVPEA